MINNDKKINQDGFNSIWQRYPERQIRQSSVWWFFLLFPKGPQGYGPKQMMFTFVGIAGDSFKLNHIEHSGLAPQPTMQGKEEHFNGLAQGWIFDGQQMHKDIVHQSGRAALSPHNLTCWAEQINGQKYGGEMRAFGDKPFGIEAKFSGATGGAHFEVWGDFDSEATTPANAFDYNTPLGGSQVVSWRRLRFAGEFAYPTGVEQLEGLGYFQRVCLNIPLVPWKWMWAAFEDKSVFSCFIIYAGAHLFRRGDKLFPGFLERATLPLRSSGYFYCNTAREMIEFDKVKVTPIAGGQFLNFIVECRSATGDFLRYRAVSHSHMQNLLDRPLFNGRRHSRYNYNEFLFQIDSLEGQVRGRRLGKESLGNGFGNCEYTWGMGLG